MSAGKLIASSIKRYLCCQQKEKKKHKKSENKDDVPTLLIAESTEVPTAVVKSAAITDKTEESKDTDQNELPKEVHFFFY